MRVTHIIGSLRAGGAERALSRLVSNGTSAIHHTVVTWHSGGALTEAVAAPADVISLGDMSESALVKIAMARRVVLSTRPDLIHGWMLHGNLFAALCGTSRVPILWGVRSTSAWRGERLRNRVALVGSVLVSRLPRSIIYNSSQAVERHVNYGYPRKKAQVIWNGIPILPEPSADDLLAWRRQCGIPLNARLILLLGRLHPVKGHEFAIRVMGTAKLSEDWHLVTVGREDGVRQTDLLALASQHGLAGRVHCLPMSRNVEYPLHAASLVIAPSLWAESFPNAVAEAGMAGRPVLASDLGETKRILGGADLVLPAGSHEVWVAHLRKLTSARAEHLAQIGQTLKTHVAANFGMAAFVQQYEDAMNAALRAANDDVSASQP